MLKEKIAEAIRQNWDVKNTVLKAVYHYRQTPHTTTQISPFEAMFGRHMRTELTNMKPNDNKEIAKPPVQKPVNPAKKVENLVDQKRVNPSKPSLKPGVRKRVIIPTKASDKKADIPLTVAKYASPKQADNPFLVDKIVDRKPVDPHNPSVYTEEGFLVSEEEELPTKK